MHEVLEVGDLAVDPAPRPVAVADQLPRAQPEQPHVLGLIVRQAVDQPHEPLQHARVLARPEKVQEERLAVRQEQLQRGVPQQVPNVVVLRMGG